MRLRFLCSTLTASIMCRIRGNLHIVGQYDFWIHTQYVFACPSYVMIVNYACIFNETWMEYPHQTHVTHSVSVFYHQSLQTFQSPPLASHTTCPLPLATHSPSPLPPSPSSTVRGPFSHHIGADEPETIRLPSTPMPAGSHPLLMPTAPSRTDASNCLTSN